MIKLLIVHDTSADIGDVRSFLTGQGFDILACDYPEVKSLTEEYAPHLLLVYLVIQNTSLQILSSVVDFLVTEKQTPFIFIVEKGLLSNLDILQKAESFIIEPIGLQELLTRIKLALIKKDIVDQNKVLVAGDLTIKPERYEVFLGKKLLELTFKEYELLFFLAKSKGKVFSRESLLSKIWGYEYFGGSRTVDVHIRRLRSKIEDAKHQFIETVRNVGYKFRGDL